MRVTVPKILVHIGEAWVDPAAVIGMDDQFGEGAPPWANSRVVLATGHILFGRRTAARIAQAVRNPERENHADEATEAYPDPQVLAAERARRRLGRGRDGAPSSLEALRSLRAESDDSDA
jgi:hypothetical protein